MNSIGPNPNLFAGAPDPTAQNPATVPHLGFGVINTLAGGPVSSIPMRQLQRGLKYTF